MKTIQTLILTMITALFFTACGGESSGNTVQDTAIDKLIAYAESKGTSEVPTLQDYIDAGVVGLTENDLADINQVVSNLTEAEVDTPDEVQTLANGFGITVKPIAHISVSKTTANEGQNIRFSASSSTDPDGNIVSYEWKEGNSVLFTIPIFDISTLTVGKHTITLKVTDNDNNVGSATISVTIKEVVVIPSSTTVPSTTVLADTTPPVMTLNGASAVDVFLNKTYTELNATANDARDGSVIVVITGSVNTATLGDYTITYTASDAAGNTATLTRTVSVISRWSRDDVKEIVIDHLDGVMWQDDVNAKLVIRNWQGAKDYCTNLSFSGYDDWILPNRGRLRSIVKTGGVPTIYSDFINVVSSWYWTTTVLSNLGVNVSFQNGLIFGRDKSINYNVRCVRRGR